MVPRQGGLQAVDALGLAPPEGSVGAGVSGLA